MVTHKYMLQLQTDLSETQDKVKESETSVSYIDSQLKPTEVRIWISKLNLVGKKVMCM